MIRFGVIGAGRNRDASHQWAYRLLSESITALVALEDRYGVDACARLASARWLGLTEDGGPW